MLTPATTECAVEPAQSFGGRAERRVLEVQQASFPSLYAASHSLSGSSLYFAAPTGQAPEGRTGTPADPARPGNSAPSRVQPTFRDASGLDDDAFEHLLQDDLGELGSTPTSQSVRPHGAASAEGLDHGSALSSGASGAVGGPSPSLAPATPAPSTPALPNDPNGGLFGGGGAAAGPAASGPSAPSVPNLVTGGHFANSTPLPGGAAATGTSAGSTPGNGGGPYGTITPFTSLPLLPSDTLPTSAGGGGCACACSGGAGTAGAVSYTGPDIFLPSGDSVPSGNSVPSGSATANGPIPTNPTSVPTVEFPAPQRQTVTLVQGPPVLGSGFGNSTGLNGQSNPVRGGFDPGQLVFLKSSGGGNPNNPTYPTNWNNVTNDSGGSGGSDPTEPGTAVPAGGIDNGGRASGDFMIDEAPGLFDASFDPGSAVSPAGVRYFDGQINISTTDLSTDGFGSTWSQTRSWSNGAPPTSFNGNGMIDTDRPELLNPNGDNSEIVLVSNATDARFFNLVNGSYVPQFFLQDQLVHNTSTGEFVFTDSVGNTIHFFDFSTSQLHVQRGQFKSCTDPKGNTISVTGWTSDGKVQEMQRSDGSTTQSYLYTYLASPDPNAGLIANITLRQKVGSGSWTVVRQVNYDYYDGTQNKPYGNLGDLRTATILDANNNVLDTTYYRYYTSADAGTVGYLHGLKYAFSPQSYARMAADLGNPLTATDAQVSPYADLAFQYDPGSQRVTQAVVQGAGCSVCSGGQGTFTYSYSTSSFSNAYNNWTYKTVETLPDGSTNTVYANYAGETMLTVFQSGGQSWEAFHQYDGSGRIIRSAGPSALTGYNPAYADLLDQNQVGDYGYLSSGSGLVAVTDYYTTTTATETTAGGAAGYYEDSKLEQGKSGTPILQETVQYFAHTGGSTVYPLASDTVYRNTDGTGAETTSYAYTWYSGTTQVQTLTVTAPVISAAENGPGVADVSVYSFDGFGRVTQTMDPDGYVNTYLYDQATGAILQQVVDSGSGHLNLTSSAVVDALGRTTKWTDPNGNVTYIVYNDPNHEVRVYPGWTGSTTTGPTEVYREDRTHDPSYTESFTMSATPHVTSGQPDGTESYAYLQSLSRTLTSKGGQVIETDDYFNLGGVPYSTNTYLGTAGTNYYGTLYT